MTRNHFGKISCMAAVLLALLLPACSNGLPEGLMPTKAIRSADPAGTYPVIGAVPEKTIPELSPEEREKLLKELNAARKKNSKAVATPLTKQVN